MSRKNFIYVDYENKKDLDLERIAGKPVEVILAVGPLTKTLPVPLVEKILGVAAQVRILKSVQVGRNALDLLIATDLGREKDRHPKAYFHILSGDKDFDSLQGNLRAQGILFARRDSLAEIPILMKDKERLAFLRQQLSGGNGVTRRDNRGGSGV